MTQTLSFTASDGACIAYTDEGAGLPLLCLAGLTRTGEDFDYLAPHLPEGVRMLRMDYRGRGRSDWTGAETYTVPREGRDALELLDHLGIARAAVIGTSRGGMIGMFLAAVAHNRLAGLCLNDIGPELVHDGLARIKDYVGRNPKAQTLEDFAEALKAYATGFEGVSQERWLQEAARLSMPDGQGGLKITYDPSLRDSFLAAFEGEAPDLWPMFDACAGLPLALIRGANSDLLSSEAAAEMRRRRPDMIFAAVPGRAHIPFLDEAESLDVIRDWLGAVRTSGRV